MRPRGAARRAAPVAQPDAARLDAARRVRPPQMPKEPEASRARQKPKSPCVRVRRRGRVAQPDAPCPSRSPTRRDSTPRAARGRRKCRRSRMPKKLKHPKVDGAGTKKIFRDGAAGGFEPAPLNRRCLPETTSPPREAGASESAVSNMKVTIAVGESILCQNCQK